MGSGQLVEPVALLRLVARGDLEATRKLRDMCIEYAQETQRNGGACGFAYYEASLFARMAADSGEMPDFGALISLLGILMQICTDSNEPERVAEYEAESIALCERVIADGGEIGEYAAEMLAARAESIAPDVMVRAKEFGKIWGATV